VYEQVVLAAANFERRMGDAAAAAALFEELLQKEREKASSIAGFLSLLYANFLRQVRLAATISNPLGHLIYLVRYRENQHGLYSRRSFCKLIAGI
jgi:hypothetical protein